jgi:hypothetical protein
MSSRGVSFGKRDRLGLGCIESFTENQSLNLSKKEKNLQKFEMLKMNPYLDNENCNADICFVAEAADSEIIWKRKALPPPAMFL